MTSEGKKTENMFSWNMIQFHQNQGIKLFFVQLPETLLTGC